MKTLKYLFGALPLFALLFCLGACDNDEGGSSTVVETMELNASVEELTLDPDKPLETVLTFTWTDAREMPDDYLITYVTKLDVLGSNFANAVRTEEDEGVFSKSYTNLELQNLLLEKWGRASNRPTSLEFEILAKWDGGPKYIMPEVRKATVSVQPYRPITFDVDKIFVDGTAIPGSRGQLALTPESEFIYVWTGSLIAGELQIPAEYQGATNYICPMADEGVTNGVAETVFMKENPTTKWTITEAGEYRVIVDIAKQTLTVYTPGNVLHAAVVDYPAGTALTVNALWIYGEPTGWAWNTGATGGDFKQSLVDPQIFYYSGSAKAGRSKIGVAPVNTSYVFGPVNTTGVKIDSVPISLGVETPIGQGLEEWYRNTYFGFPSGTNYIVMDLRRMVITVEKR